MTATTDAADALRASIDQSGLLFQSHPDIGNWEATRAVAPEIAAYTNKHVAPAFDRLRIIFHAEGETDEDGYTYTTDTWQVEYMDLATHDHPDDRDTQAYHWGEPDVFTDREAMLDHVVGVMTQVSEERA